MKSSTKYSPLLLNWCIYFVKGGKYHVLGWQNQNYKDSATEFLESEFIVTFCHTKKWCVLPSLNICKRLKIDTKISKQNQSLASPLKKFIGIPIFIFTTQNVIRI